MEKLVFFLVVAGMGVTGYTVWRKWKAKQERLAREAAEQAEEAERERQRRLQRALEKERQEAAEQRLRERQEQLRREEEERRREAERQRVEELQRRREEMARLEAEEKRQLEEARRKKERQVDLFIEKYVRPLAEPEGQERRSLDEEIAFKRQLFRQGTEEYRKRNYFDDYLFHRRVGNFLEKLGRHYVAMAGSATAFGFFTPYLETFERQLLEYATVEYFYAKKSGILHYGNLKGNRELGVDMILVEEDRCSLVSCLLREQGKEKVSMAELIERYEKLEMYRRDFLVQTYPEFAGMEVDFILVVGGKGTDDLDVDAYRFAKKRFARVLTIQGIVTFLDFEKPKQEAHEKYLQPVLPEV